MVSLPGGWRRLTARKKRGSFPSVKRAKVELCQPCLNRSKLEIVGWFSESISQVMIFPAASFLRKSPNLLPCGTCNAGLSDVMLFLFTLCFDSSCSPGLQSFLSPQLFSWMTYSCCRTQQKCQPVPCRLLRNFSTPDRVRNILFLWLQYLVTVLMQISKYYNWNY